MLRAATKISKLFNRDESGHYPFWRLKVNKIEYFDHAVTFIPKNFVQLKLFFSDKKFFCFFFKILKLGRKFFCPLFFEIFNFFALFYSLWIKKKPFFQFFAIVLKF